MDVEFFPSVDMSEGFFFVNEMNDSFFNVKHSF